LVKIVVSQEKSVRDAIIRATNNQTAVETVALHATDKIQRDVEEVLLRSGYFYERRTKHYANQGHPASHIVSPLYVASGFVSLLLKAPSSAATLKSRFMRNEVAYERVFSESAPLEVWPAIAGLLKKVDSFLDTVRPGHSGASEHFLKNWRHIVALVAAARVTGRFSFSAAELASLTSDAVTIALLETTWEVANRHYRRGGKIRRGDLKARDNAVCRAAAEKWGLANVEAVKITIQLLAERAGPPSQEFIERVDAVLPEQPWKRGVHHDVAKQLGCRASAVFSAIRILVDLGRRHRQRDGVVCASDDSITATDNTRESSKSPNRDSGDV
jgi:hypothetical protein